MTLACKKAFVVDGEHLSTNTNVLTNASDAIPPRNHCAASDQQRAPRVLPQKPPERSCVLEGDEVCYVCYPRNHSPKPRVDGWNQQSLAILTHHRRLQIKLNAFSVSCLNED